MLGGRRLTLLFASILAELAAPACGADGDCSYEQVTGIGKDRLAPFLADGKLSFAECQVLCPGGPPSDSDGDPHDETSSSGTSASTTSGPTTGATTTDTITAATTGVVDDSLSGRSSKLLGCSPVAGNASDVRCKYAASCKGGRRPAGLRSEGRSGGEDPIAWWFAEVAHLEAASVPAFERLAAELGEHDAPAELIDAALEAAIDEAHHADLVGALARGFGGRPSPVELAPLGRRSLVDLAIDNAIEGCVGETWAALVAAHQARSAEDPEIRACMAEIAVDEADHAALSWAIDAWIAPRLSADERSRVIAARSQATLALRELHVLDEALQRRAGLPAQTTAHGLWEALDRELWSAAA